MPLTADGLPSRPYTSLSKGQKGQNPELTQPLQTMAVVAPHVCRHHHLCVGYCILSRGTSGHQAVHDEPLDLRHCKLRGTCQHAPPCPCNGGRAGQQLIALREPRIRGNLSYSSVILKRRERLTHLTRRYSHTLPKPRRLTEFSQVVLQVQGSGKRSNYHQGH